MKKNPDDDQGEELIDIDEKGNSKEKKDEKDRSSKGKYLLFLIIIFLIFVIIYFLYVNKKNKRSVFDKTKLKNLNLKNRIFYGAEFDYSFIVNETIPDKIIKKYENLAKDGVSIIITPGTIVGDINEDIKGAPRIDKDNYIESYIKLVESIHKQNSYIIMQLVHVGLFSGGDIIYSPSINKGFLQDKDSIEMTKEDILRVEKNFVEASIRAKKAGFDGVEIHACHLTLLATFLSAKFNRRTDEYGGSYENRARIVIEIIKKIREALGDNFVIGIKIDSEGKNESVEEEEFLSAGIMAEEAGIDYIEVSGNNWNEKNSHDLLYYESTKKLAEKVKIPIVLIGGVNNFEQVEHIISDSKIEYIGIVRALKKDPELIKKWSQNK